MLYREDQGFKAGEKDTQWISALPQGLTTTEWLQLAVCSINFEIFFGVVIIANAVAMAAARQYEGMRSEYLLGYRDAADPRERWQDAEETLEALEWIFGILILGEVVVKMLILRMKFFLVTPWNWFDLLLVLTWAFDRVQAMGMILNPTLIRLARVARVMRIIRVFRWLAFLDTLMLLVKALHSAKGGAVETGCSDLYDVMY